MDGFPHLSSTASGGRDVREPTNKKVKDIPNTKTDIATNITSVRMAVSSKFTSEKLSTKLRRSGSYNNLSLPIGSIPLASGRSLDDDLPYLTCEDEHRFSIAKSSEYLNSFVIDEPQSAPDIITKHNKHKRKGNLGHSSSVRDFIKIASAEAEHFSNVASIKAKNKTKTTFGEEEAKSSPKPARRDLLEDEVGLPKAIKDETKPDQFKREDEEYSHQEDEDEEEIDLCFTKTHLGSYYKVDVGNWKKEHKPTDSSDRHLRKELLEKSLNRRTRKSSGCDTVSPLAKNKSHSSIGKTTFFHMNSKGSLSVSGDLVNIRLFDEEEGKLQKLLTAEIYGLITLIFNDLKMLEEGIVSDLETIVLDLSEELEESMQDSLVRGKCVFLLDSFYLKSRNVLKMFCRLISDFPEVAFSHVGLGKPIKEYISVLSKEMDTLFSEKALSYKDLPEYKSILKCMSITEEGSAHQFLLSGSEEIVSEVLEESLLFMERESSNKDLTFKGSMYSLNNYLHNFLFRDLVDEIQSILERKIESLKEKNKLIFSGIPSLFEYEVAKEPCYLGGFYITEDIRLDLVASANEFIKEKIIRELISTNGSLIDKFEANLIKGINIGKIENEDINNSVDNFFKKHFHNHAAYVEAVQTVSERIANIKVMDMEGNLSFATLKEKESIVNFFKKLIFDKLTPEYCFPEMLARLKSEHPIIFTASPILLEKVNYKIDKICSMVSEKFDRSLEVLYEVVTEKYAKSNHYLSYVDILIERGNKFSFDEFLKISQKVSQEEFDDDIREIIECISEEIGFFEEDVSLCYGNVVECRLSKIYHKKTSDINSRIKDCSFLYYNR